MSIAAIILVGSPLLALFGLMLFVRAQRVQTRFVCRACEYDLRGSPDSTNCPECGSTLEGAAVCVPGDLQVRRIQLVIGLLLTVVGIVVFLLGGLPLAMAMKMTSF